MLTQPQGRPNDTEVILVNNYQLTKIVRKNSSSEVRFGVHLISKKKVAAKIESLNAQMQLLKHEKEMYDQLKESNGVADVYYYEDNWNNRYRILVMQQLGHNLESLFTLCHKQFTLKTILYIAIELITHLQTIHSRDILYRNCTPKNFLIGLDEKGLKHLYVVDFACSKLYIDPRTRQHIVDKCDPSIKLGQLRYMSLNVHRGHEHSRRDDLESLGYMFMYFLKQGKLPWSKLKTPQGKASEKERLIYKRKCATPIEMLCLGFHDAFAFFFRQVMSLSFTAEPNYKNLQLRFVQIFKENFLEDGKYDWETKM